MNKQRSVKLISEFVYSSIKKGEIKNFDDFLTENGFLFSQRKKVNNFLFGKRQTTTKSTHQTIQSFINLLRNKLGFKCDEIDLHSLTSSSHKISLIAKKQKGDFGYNVFDNLDIDITQIRIVMHNLVKNGEVERVKRGVFRFKRKESQNENN